MWSMPSLSALLIHEGTGGTSSFSGFTTISVNVGSSRLNASLRAGPRSSGLSTLQALRPKPSDLDVVDGLEVGGEIHKEIQNRTDNRHCPTLDALTLFPVFPQLFLNMQRQNPQL